MSKRTGGCACGCIRFEIKGDPMAAGACYCRDCQYSAGGAPTYAALFGSGQVEIIRGDPKVYWTAAASGNRVGRHFCADCGTPLFSESSVRPGTLAVTAGSLDEPGEFAPQFQIWLSSAQPWHRPDPDLPKFERSPIPSVVNSADRPKGGHDE